MLPVLGPVAAGKFPVVYGTAREAATTLFVSRGLGTVYVPVRVNCPPEVAVLTLTPAELAERKRPQPGLTPLRRQKYFD